MAKEKNYMIHTRHGDLVLKDMAPPATSGISVKWISALYSPNIVTSLYSPYVTAESSISFLFSHLSSHAIFSPLLRNFNVKPFLIARACSVIFAIGHDSDIKGG